MKNKRGGASANAFESNQVGKRGGCKAPGQNGRFLIPLTAIRCPGPCEAGGSGITSRMRYEVITHKPAAQAAEDVQTVAKQHGFGTLHVYDLKETLTSKGFPQSQACFILEVCSPAQANKVLGIDFSLNVALPCRISVYENEGKTRIGMFRPKAMLDLLSDDPALRTIANEVEASMVKIIDESK